MAEISYVNTVNVNVSGIPQGMSEFVVANIALFTNEEAGFADEYKVYVDATEVAADFGADSLTAQMANAIFAQSPNLRSGSGSLIVAPYVATSGTAATLTTVKLDTILSNLKTVTNGEFAIVVGGNTIKFTKLDLRSVKTVNDFVTILNSKDPDVWVEEVEGAIRFTAKQVGKDVTIAFGSAGGGGTSLLDENYLGLGSEVVVEGTDAVDEETLAEAVTRISDKIYFGGILDTVCRENESIEAAAKAIEALSKKVYVEVTASLANIAVLGKTIKEGGYKKTRIVAHSIDGFAEAKCMAAAYLSKALCTNYNGSQTCITMNLKELTTINPDKRCNNSTFQLAKANGVDIYGYTSGLGCTYSFRNAGGYMDDQTGIMAFIGQLEVAAFNYLKQTNGKVPQTEIGMSGLKDCLADVCERFVNNGYFGIGNTWNTASKFGDPEDFDRNISERGYYIYSLPIARQAQSERQDRIAPLIQIAGKSAGAIHMVNICGTIEA